MHQLLTAGGGEGQRNRNVSDSMVWSRRWNKLQWVATIVAMESSKLDRDVLIRQESDADRVARLQVEAAEIIRAYLDIEAGLGIEDGDLETMLDQVEHDAEASKNATPH